MPGLRSLVARRRATLPSQSPVSTAVDVRRSPKSADAKLEAESIRKSLEWPLTNSCNYSSTDLLFNNISCSQVDKMDTGVSCGISSNSMYNSAPDLSSNLSWYLNDKMNASKKFLNIDQCSDQTAGKDSGYGDDCPVLNSGMNHSPKSQMYTDNLSTSSFPDDKCVETGPERIVIKMKLMHKSSFENDSANQDDCDITCIESDNGEKESGTKSKYTRWTIDTIINAPVENIKKEPIDDDISQFDSTDKQNYFDTNSNLMSDSNKSQSIDTDNSSVDSSTDGYRSDGNSLNGKSIKLYFGNNLVSKNIVLDFKECFNNPSGIGSPTSSETDQSSLASSLSSRRESHSSDISTDSDANARDKGCNLVIKRVENSDSYSCIRTGSKKQRDISRLNSIANSRPKRRAAVLAGEKCLVSLANFDTSRKITNYIKRTSVQNKCDLKAKTVRSISCDDNLITPFQEKRDIQCSVQLCDVFKNQSLSRLVCPGCFQSYDAQNNAVINLGEKTLSLECVKCNWLVVRRLIHREIDVPSFNYNGDAIYRSAVITKSESVT